ncbi:Hypothetical protein SCF082_LOCUS52968 [Durusdinium trenchii]|uniref:RanBP2-type domain-containing protein n=1 Tax=Durusdinium trenchii TaxID=1381693 RepID=A0ABP0SPI2_9DINO
MEKGKALNFAFRRKCFKCKAEKPRTVHRNEGDWICTLCSGGLNSMHQRECFRCGEPTDEQDEPKKEAPAPLTLFSSDHPEAPAAPRRPKRTEGRAIGRRIEAEVELTISPASIIVRRLIASASPALADKAEEGEDAVEGEAAEGEEAAEEAEEEERVKVLRVSLMLGVRRVQSSATEESPSTPLGDDRAGRLGDVMDEGPRRDGRGGAEIGSASAQGERGAMLLAGREGGKEKEDEWEGDLKENAEALKSSALKSTTSSEVKYPRILRVLISNFGDGLHEKLIKEAFMRATLQGYLAVTSVADSCRVTMDYDDAKEVAPQEAVKVFARLSPSFKKSWVQYCRMLRDTSDPSKLELEFIQQFLDYLGALIEADLPPQPSLPPLATKPKEATVSIRRSVVDCITKLNETGKLKKELRLEKVAQFLSKLEEEKGLQVLALLRKHMLQVADPNEFVRIQATPVLPLESTVRMESSRSDKSARHAIRVAHPSFGEREVALEPGPLQEQLASLCEASGIAYDEDEDLKVLVTDWDVVLGHADDFEALPRRPPYRLVAAVDLAEAQLQGVEASSRKASSKALKVLLQSIHGNESFAQEVIAQAGIPLLLQALAASAPDQLDLETATAAPWELAATAVAELLHYESGAYFCEENAEEVFSEETFTVLMKLAYSGAKACSALLILLLLTQPAATLGCLKTQLKPLLQICAKEESPQEATMLLKVIQDAVQELKAAKEEDLLRDLEEALVPETHDQAQVLEEKLGPRMLQPLVEDLLSASLSSACHQLQRDAFAEQNLSLKAQARQRTQEDLTVERLTEQIRRLDKAMTKMLDFIELENHRPMELWLQDLVRKGFSAMPAWPHGQTPLHYFAQFMEDERLAELLIALGCPLLGCEPWQKSRISEFLSVTRVDQQGFTPAQRATQRGRHDLTFLLQAEGPGETSASVLSFIQLSDDDRPEEKREIFSETEFNLRLKEAQLRALAKKCQGYLHKYPSSGAAARTFTVGRPAEGRHRAFWGEGQRFLWTTMQKRYFAIRSNRKAKGGRATLCWELGYWESFEAFEDPGGSAHDEWTMCGDHVERWTK